MNYRLLEENPGLIVIPPEVASSAVSQRTIVTRIAAGPGPCGVESAAIRIDSRQHKARIAVNRERLLRQPAGWVTAWSIRAESEGCVGPGLSVALANRVVQSVPLDSAAAFRLLHTNSVVAGFVDLGPASRVEVRSPVFAQGTAADEALDAPVSKVSGEGNHVNVDLIGAANLVGVETAWYAIENNTGRPGYHFSALSAERAIAGKVEITAAPAIDYLRFPAEASFFRLLYKSDDNGVQAIVVAGTTADDLERRTNAVKADAAACEQAAGMCLALPHRVGVNPFLTVSVNGRAVTLPLQATLGDAIRMSGTKLPETILPTLQVTKPFGDRQARVEFRRDTPAILGLQLLGGERISW